MKIRLHLIGNSHLDPVWLWDWREGLNESLITCRTIVRLMDEYSQLTYIRGETSIYRHIQEHDRPLFGRILDLIRSGRWDVVGGTLCQPDTNLPATEVLNRHFTVGLDYMRRELGVRPRVAWAADSFGHSAGWPEIYAAAGMRYFACSRPNARDCPLPSPAFWWEGPGGSRVLSWRLPLSWYGSDRDETVRRLDSFRAQAAGWGLQNVAITYGMGNHGGGPTARQIREILAWKEANQDVEVEFSTFHRFFDALAQENKAHPVVKQELNFTLRGCYASAFRYKRAYRRTENLLLAAERATSLVSAALGHPAPDLGAAWDALLFNTFHDILPGSLVETAFEDQQAWLGVAYHEARRHELASLTLLAAQCDTRVPEPAPDMPAAVPVVWFNPHPAPLTTLAEFEVCLDYRPIRAYAHRPDDLPVEVIDHAGKPAPFQFVPPDHGFYEHLPWRKRLLVPVTLPPCGYQVLHVAWKEKPRLARPRATPLRSRGDTSIANASLSVSARPGDAGVRLRLDGKSLLGKAGLRVATFDDPFGTWGNHDGERGGDDISTVLAEWTVARTKVLETGPLRAALWVEFRSGASRLELTFFLERDARFVRVAARLLWTERAARLKLVFDGAGDSATFEVPGGEVVRPALGEVPGGRWVRAAAGFVFASDALYNFDLKDGALRATVLRSSRYATNPPSAADDAPWRPRLDLGEHRFAFALGAADARPWTLAEGLEQPPLALFAPPHDGPLGRSGTLASLPPGPRLLAIKRPLDGEGWIVRIQLSDTDPVVLTWLGARVPLGRGRPFEIVSWRLRRRAGKWAATRVTTAEGPPTPEDQAA